MMYHSHYMNDSLKPLEGQRILVTRSRHQASSLVNELQQVGAMVYECPVIQIQALSDERKQKLVDKALLAIKQFDRLIITSANGARALLKRMADLSIPLNLLSSLKIDTVGPKTSQVLHDAGLNVEPLPDVYQAEGLLDALLPKLAVREHILIYRSNLARDVLPRALTQRGHVVTALDAYETVLCREQADDTLDLLQQLKIDLVTFTSSSTVHNFMTLIHDKRLIPQKLLADVSIACIGPITAQTVESYGLVVTHLAKQATIEALVAEICQ